MKDSPLVAGRVRDGGVRRLLEEHPATFRSLPYVLISWLDSGRPGPDVPWLAGRQPSDSGWAVTFEPLVVSGAALVELNAEGRFTGFDEIWVLDAPVTEHPPSDANLLAPVRLDDGVPDAVRSWLVSSGCRAGFGDGEGLNYVVADRSLADELGLS